MINDIKSGWKEICQYLMTEKNITVLVFDIWIKPIFPEYVSTNDEGKEVLHFVLDNDAYNEIYKNEDNVSKSQDGKKLFCNIVNKKYSHIISEAIEEIFDKKYIVKVELQSSKKTSRKTGKKDLKSESLDELRKKANLNPKYTFDKFVVGKSNSFAHAASLAVAENPGGAYNPLFIHGGVGLGKTHLMQSIANFVITNNPEAKVLYETSENFTNEVIQSIKQKRTSELREKYRKNDVLLIDDIQFIIKKEGTQEEFFHTFNDLINAKKQIVISSDKPPRELTLLEERIKSRLAQGLAADIQLPDYETRMAILRRKEEEEKANIDNEVIQYIAQNIKDNIRVLEGALLKVIFTGTLEKREVDLELAKKVLKDIIDPDSEKEVNPELIIQIVAEHFNISAEDMIKKTRTADITYPRHIAMYLCREILSKMNTYKEIGDVFGGRDHTTVMSAVSSIEEKIKNNPETISAIDVIRKKISPQ